MTRLFGLVEQIAGRVTTEGSRKARVLPGALAAMVTIAMLGVYGSAGLALTDTTALAAHPRPSPSPTPTPSSTSTPTPSQSGGVWTVISSPNQGTSNNQLLGVSPISSSDLWSVGYYNAGLTANSLRTLAEHWGGSGWSVVSTPNVATGAADYNWLRGIAAVSSNNVWAVGYSGNANVLGDQSLIEHWDGTQWKILSSPNRYASQHLYGIAAVSASDIWAVGQYFNYNPYSYGALIAHWNGTTWKKVSNPATYPLYGVTALAANNVWAVGGSQLLHWDGTAWSVVPSPQPPCCGNGYDLRAVAAVSASNIWAVGYAQIASGDGYTYGPLIEHWDGSSWQLGGSAAGDSLYGVTALSATGVWAVGVSGGLNFVEKWDGTQWTRQSSPNVGTSNNTFEAATAVPSTGDVWAVGEYYQPTTSYQYLSQTLVERCQAC